MVGEWFSSKAEYQPVSPFVAQLKHSSSLLYCLSFPPWSSRPSFICTLRIALFSHESWGISNHISFCLWTCLLWWNIGGIVDDNLSDGLLAVVILGIINGSTELAVEEKVFWEESWWDWKLRIHLLSLWKILWWTGIYYHSCDMVVVWLFIFLVSRYICIWFHLYELLTTSVISHWVIKRPFSPYFSLLTSPFKRCLGYIAVFSLFFFSLHSQILYLDGQCRYAISDFLQKKKKSFLKIYRCQLPLEVLTHQSIVQCQARRKYY